MTLSQYDGFINLLKPPGMTSHDAVAKVRRIMGTRSVGHAGTLDPAASGVLPLAIGKATRLLEYLVSASKTYIGEATFGLETDTLDQVGQIVARVPAQFSELQLRQELQSMIGVKMQAPPAFSAVKHQGKRLYEYARAGEMIDMPGRPIEIYDVQLRTFSQGEHPRCLFRLDCSKGTYVRVFVKDLAASLRTVATLSFLLRARVGEMDVMQSITLPELVVAREQERLAEVLLPMDIALQHLPRASLSNLEAERFLRGQTVLQPPQADSIIGVYHESLLLGIGQLTSGLLQPRKVLATQEDIIDVRN